jgi:hypothetical protein
MSGRKSVIGLAALFALVLCAFAAANASAAQRAWTCAPTGSGYSDAHCVTATGTGFSAVEIANGTATKITGTNAKTASGTTAAEVSKLKGTISGLETEVQCTGLNGSGELTNAAESVSGTGTINYTTCTVTKPAGRECKVKNGTVTTNLLKATTVGQAANKLKFEPNTGTEFAKVPIEGCLNNKPPAAEYPVSGSLIANTSGATTTTTHAEITTQGTLTFGGNASGIEGALTISMEGGNPIFLK